ncbi:MAG TPA: polyprenol monophosphomannose synthase [Demequina sp.]|nr:polyprenol monophosphomannose synthase [Demequina sp.]
MKTLVIIPTYNERENIRDIVTRVRREDVDVLVADDASPDGTGAIADELAAADPRVFVKHRAGKEGLGRAYIDAFGWGLARDYTHLVEMDADGSHRPEQLPLLLERAARADLPDLVIGSRWVPGGEVVNWPWSRMFLSRAGNLYVRLWLGLPAADATAGFRVYRSEILRRIDFDTVGSSGYYFQVEMTRQAALAGGVVVEVPISFIERERGTSKMSNAIVREAMVRTTLLGARHRWQQVRAALRR